MHQDYTVESEDSSIRNDIDKLLHQSEFMKLKDYCTNKENHENVSQNAWDLLTQMMTFLKDEKSEKDDLKIFVDIFAYISTIANCKEFFLGLLEQFDPMVELDIVELLFPALKACSTQFITQDKPNQCHNLSMLFCTLIYYVDSLNLPKYASYQPMDNSEEKEELQIASYILQCVDLENSLISVIIKHFDENNINIAHLKKVNREFMCFSSSLLERLSHLDMDEKKQTAKAGSSICQSCHDEIEEQLQEEIVLVKSTGERKSIQTANKLCAFLRKIEDPFQLFREMRWSKLCMAAEPMVSDDENKRFELSRAVYIYLNLLKEHEVMYFPQVLHPVYVLVCSLPAIIILWKSANPVQVHKGMELARFVTNRIDQRILQCDYLSCCYQLSKVTDAAQTVLNEAVNIAMRCPTLVLRQRAVQFLKKFLDKFDWPDRYKFLHELLSSSEHPGVVGYLIGYFKDKLAELLQTATFKGSQKFFMEKRRLFKLFEICVDLPCGSDTDLLAEYDKIMASLNLLRFLCIRDVHNRTGIYNEVDLLRNSYLNPLRTAINLSRMHFRDELQKQSKQGRVVDPSQPTVMINGISLSTLPLEDRKQALQSAVNSFDVLQSVCIRVQELVDKVPATVQG